MNPEELIVGRWYYFSLCNHYAKVTGEVTYNEIPSKEYIFKGKYTNDGSAYNIDDAEGAVLLSDEQLLEILPENHPDRPDQTPLKERLKQISQELEKLEETNQ